MDGKTGNLGEFQTFMSQLKTIPENKKEFYIHWVRRFLRFCDYQLENINPDRVSIKIRFVGGLTENGRRVGGLFSQRRIPQILSGYCYSDLQG
jgi:hypothetical protein